MAGCKVEGRWLINTEAFMIAPIRETETQIDANARLLARARRAVAAALLREPRAAATAKQKAAWQPWLFAAWTLLALAWSIGLTVGFWKLPVY